MEAGRILISEEEIAQRLKLLERLRTAQSPTSADDYACVFESDTLRLL